jgi:RNA polymerase sigma-70 factor, ECF subfamily
MDSGLVSRSEGALSAAAVGTVESAVAAAPAHTPAMDDTALMLRYRDGDVRAFEILYERHKAPLYRYLRRTCHSREVADDVFQEVWSKVIASRGRYEVRAQFNTFLFRIAHNCAIDHFRRAGRRQESGAPSADELAEQLGDAEHERPDAALSESELRSDFRRALDQLPPEQRDVFVLYEESGLSLEDIGKVTGVAMETAKSRLRYALTKLRGALEQHRPARLKPGVQS